MPPKQRSRKVLLTSDSKYRSGFGPRSLASLKQTVILGAVCVVVAYVLLMLIYGGNRVSTVEEDWHHTSLHGLWNKQSKEGRQDSEVEGKLHSRKQLADEDDKSDADDPSAHQAVPSRTGEQKGKQHNKPSKKGKGKKGKTIKLVPHHFDKNALEHLIEDTIDEAIHIHNDEDSDAAVHAKGGGKAAHKSLGDDFLKNAGKVNTWMGKGGTKTFPNGHQGFAQDDYEEEPGAQQQQSRKGATSPKKKEKARKQDDEDDERGAQKQQSKKGASKGRNSGGDDDVSFFHKKPANAKRELKNEDEELLPNPFSDGYLDGADGGEDEEEKEVDRVEQRLARAKHPREPAGPIKFGKDGVAVNFDWQEYLLMYRELKEAGIVSEAAARDHYSKYGRNEGRLPRVPPLYLQYTACRVVYEQYYCHLAAFTLAMKLRAELVLPPSLIKDGDGLWQPTALSAVLDVGAVQETAAATKQLLFHQVSAEDAVSIPDFNEEGFDEDVAYPEYKFKDLPEKYVLHMDKLYHKLRALDDIVGDVYSRVGGLAVQNFKKGEWNGGSEFTLLVNLPCIFYSLDARTALPELQNVAELIKLPHKLIKLADEAYKSLQDKGYDNFNGFVVKGYEDWLAFTTSKFPTFWYKYKRAIESELKNSTLPCFIGFEELVDVKAGWEKLKKQLVDHTKGCSRIYNKLHLVEENEIYRLHDQQQSLVDFLVLLKAKKVMGNYKSLMLLFLNEYRHLHDMRNADDIVRVQTKIETDKDDNEIDSLSWGGVFTLRHAQGLRDPPQLFLGPKGYKLKAKQHAVEYNPFKNVR